MSEKVPGWKPYLHQKVVDQGTELEMEPVLLLQYLRMQMLEAWPRWLHRYFCQEQNLCVPA